MDEGARIFLMVLLLLVISILVYTSLSFVTTSVFKEEDLTSVIKLPKPFLDGGISVEKALSDRRSVRSYSNRLLSLSEVGQILWSAQGITSSRGYRTAPSAGALYPITLYVFIGRVEGISPGVYRYHPDDHGLSQIVSGDKRMYLMQAALNQTMFKDAQITLLYSATPELTKEKYGSDAMKYIYVEAGHAAQNVYLESESIGLGTVVVGAFDEVAVGKILGFTSNEIPIYLQPVGALN